MAKDNSELPRLPKHGALVLPRVEVKSYNVEIEDTTGYVGDKASKSAFWELLDKWRKPLNCDHASAHRNRRHHQWRAF